MKETLVSVVIPTKGRINEALECINSILNQTLLPHEIIIIDSSKNTSLSSFLKRRTPTEHTKIKYVYFDACLTAARNKGVQQSSGNIIFFFDDDVVLDRDYIKEVVKVFRDDRDGSIAGVMGKITNIRTNMSALNTAFRRLFFLSYFGDGKFRSSGITTSVQHEKRIVKTNFLTGCGMAYRRKIFREFTFDEKLEKLSGYCYREDVDFSYRVSRKYTLMFTPFAKLEHRQSKKSRINSMLTKRQHIFNHYYLFKRNMPKHLTNLIAFCLSILGLLLLSIARKNARRTAGILRGILDIMFNYQ